MYSCEVAINDLEQIAIYQVNGYYNLDDNSHPVFTTQCVPRIWSYVIVHGLIAVFVGAICTVFIHKCCKDPHTRFTFSRRSEERAPLLTNQLPPSYSTVALSPPKYEDIAKDFDEDLPSYSDVLSYTTNGQCNFTIQIANPTSNNTSTSSISDTRNSSGNTVQSDPSLPQNTTANETANENANYRHGHSDSVAQNCSHSHETSVEEHCNRENSNLTNNTVLSAETENRPGTIITVQIEDNHSDKVFR